MTRKKTASRKKTAGKKPTVRKKTASRRSSQSRAKKPGLFSQIRRYALMLTVLGIVSVGLYSIYLSQVVTIKFEGKRWAVPARVFARSLELYAGASITPEMLKAELNRLGYRHQKQPSQAGTWGKSGNTFRINTRDFQFWDETVLAQRLRVQTSAERIESIIDSKGREVALVRLEAPVIDSIYPSHNEDRVLLKYDDIPEQLIKALLAIEDRDFYSHHGVSPKSILRAILANFRSGQIVQGGSTLTQQLAKNFFLSSERTIIRKINEALMALIIDARYEKDDILEAYANEIYLGQDGKRAIHGFGLASRFYFNIPVNELDLSRIALLAGIIKGPSYYDPRRHPQRALKRRNLVIDVMQQQGMVDKTVAEKAKKADLGLNDNAKGKKRGYPAFVQLVRQQLKRDYREEDLTSEGLRIFTTLDPWVQQQADRHAEATLSRLEKQKKLPVGSLEVGSVIARVSSGEIVALIGGRESRYLGFNRALDAVRPIGSLVKPLVYLTALMQPQRYSLISQLKDEPVTLKQQDGSLWTPKNYDGKSHGNVSLINALAYSYNQATVNLGLEIGVEKVIDTLNMAGINRDIKPYPSMLLGALALSPYEVTQMYQTLASGGFYSPLRAISEVLDKNNQPLQRYPLTVKQALPDTPVYLLNTALQSVVNVGTAKSLKAKFPIDYQFAGKTGTTNDLRDSWYAGFSGDLVGAVWVGRDDNKKAGLTGAGGAMQVWGDIFRRINPEPLVLYPTADTEMVLIDETNGLRASDSCENTVRVPFLRGNGPDRESPCVEKSKGFFERLFD